jgi:hypothetical protein
MLTMLLAVVGIALSFPVGVLLALGRRSKLPVIRYFSIRLHRVDPGSPADHTALYGDDHAAALFAQWLGQSLTAGAGQ